MNVLVDTCVWSLALRRKTKAATSPEVDALSALIGDGRVIMAGVVRQELLSGIKQATDYETLRQHMRAFPDVALQADDHELAASFFNACRAKGIHGSSTDLLLCAIAASRYS